MRRSESVLTELSPPEDALRVCADGALTVEQATTFSGIGRTRLYEMVGAGDIKTVRIGKRRLIPRAELVRILAEHVE